MPGSVFLRQNSDPGRSQCCIVFGRESEGPAPTMGLYENQLGPCIRQTVVEQHRGGTLRQISIGQILR